MELVCWALTGCTRSSASSLSARSLRGRARRRAFLCQLWCFSIIISNTPISSFRVCHTHLLPSCDCLHKRKQLRLIPHESNNSYYNNILSVSLSVTKPETTEVALKLALSVVFLLSDWNPRETDYCTFSLGSRLMVLRGRRTRRTLRDLMVLMSLPFVPLCRQKPQSEWGWEKKFWWVITSTLQ